MIRIYLIYIFIFIYKFITDVLVWILMKISDSYLDIFINPNIDKYLDLNDDSDSDDDIDEIPLSNYHLDILKHLDMTNNCCIPDNHIIECKLLDEKCNYVDIKNKFKILLYFSKILTTNIIKEYFKNYKIIIIKYKKNNNIIIQIIDLKQNYCIYNRKYILFGRIKL